MKKIILTIATAMISVFAMAQNPIAQSILESTGYSSIYDLSYRQVGNFGGAGPSYFKLCSSMNPSVKVESQGAMFFLSGSITPHDFEVAGFICYFPKEIWNNQKLKNLWMQDNSNWIFVYDLENPNRRKYEFTGSEYEGFLREASNDNTSITGFWYMNSFPTNNGYGDTYGRWWNGKQFEQGFKSLYVIYDTLNP